MSLATDARMKPRHSCLGSAREWELFRDHWHQAIIRAVCGDYTILRLADSNFWEAWHAGKIVFTGSLSAAAVKCVGPKAAYKEVAK